MTCEHGWRWGQVGVSHIFKDPRALRMDISLLFENTIAFCALKLTERRLLLGF